MKVVIALTARFSAHVFFVFLVLAAPAARADDVAMAFTLDEVQGSGSPAPEAPQDQPAQAAPDVEAQLATILRELRWGMTSKELLAVFKARLRADYDQQIKVQRDILRQDALYQEALARYEAIKHSFVVFEGKKSGWDVSPIAPEFRHGSHEAMLVVKGEESRDYYFFINDRLWKWYRELEPGARGGAGFDGLAEAMQAQLGPAKLEPTQRAQDAPALPSATWESSQTRVTLLDHGATPCLILESKTTLASLAILRKDAVARGPSRNAVLEGVLMDSDARERWRETVDNSHSPIDTMLARRSRQ